MKKIFTIMIALFIANQLFSQVTLTSVAKIGASNSPLNSLLGVDDRFGYSTDTIGDLDDDGVTDWIIGAPGYQSKAGSVVVLFMNADKTVKGCKRIGNGLNGFPNGLLAIGAAPGNMFGRHVAGIGDIDGDNVEDIAVGADEGLDVEEWYDQGVGSVWILLMNTDGTVKNYKWLKNRSVELGDSLEYGSHFNYGLHSMGDIDGNGVNDIAGGMIVGMNALPNGDTTYGGKIYYLLMNNDGTVNRVKFISTPPVIVDNDFFGSDIAQIGDINGDGYRDLLVGSYGYSNPSNLSGAAYILFMQNDTVVLNWKRISSFESGFNSSVELMDMFGYSVAGLGDIDNDGVPDVSISMPYNDDNGANKGAVFVLLMKNDGEVKTFYEVNATNNIMQPLLDNDDYFGLSISSVRTNSQTGNFNILVGAFGDDDGGSQVGSVYLLDYSVTTDVDESMDNINLSLYPNPTRNELLVNLLMKNSSEVKIRVFDVLGRELNVLDGYIYAGEHFLKGISLNDYPKGSYVISVETDNYTKRQAVIKN